jgi:hypothetical protein
LAYELNLVFVPSSDYKPFLAFLWYFVPIPISSSNDDSEDENPPFPTHLPPYQSIEQEPAPKPPLPRWICSTQEATSDLVDDPSDQCQTHS